MLIVPGWLVIAAWQALLAGASYLEANMLVAVVSMNNPTYAPKPWHGTLLLWAFTVVAVMLNAFANPLLPKIEIVLLFLHLAGWLAILVPLIAVSTMPCRHNAPADAV